MNLLQIHEPGQTPLPHAETLAVGIDLGTTHSVVAVASSPSPLAGEGGVGDDSQPVSQPPHPNLSPQGGKGLLHAEVLHNIHGHALVPSVVYYAPDGSVEVGYSARQRHARGEKNIFASVKRQMGKTSDAMPVKVSAEILKELKRNAERALGKEVTQAVITVPAYFDDAARTATKDAARLAGLEVLRLINEPTAAALAYGLDKGAEGIYAIYDLGGGTFDISLLKMEKGVFQVLATGGDTELGGDDIDEALAAVIPSLLVGEGKGGGVLTTELARAIKEKLTIETMVGIPLSPTLPHKEGGSRQFTRVQLETIARPFIERSLRICEQAFADAKLSPAQVKGIVLVGGSTRMPLVRQMVGQWFGQPPLTDVNPDEVVALGAALQAHGLTQGSNNLLLDVIPLSLGLETMGGIVEKLIYRNTPIPVSISQEFTTYQDGQDGISVHVVQGEREMAAHNRSLAKFDLTGIPPLPAGIARVKVTFNVDADGLLTVSARENTTGTEQLVHVKPSYGLPPEEIEAMLRESMEHARKDITERLLVEARVEAERTIFELESALKADGDLLSEAKKAQLARQMGVVRNVILGENRDYIDAEAHELARLAQPFAEKRMDRAVGGALKGASIDKIMSS